MGWSEKYWEDVRSELEQAATESEPTDGDDTPDYPALDRPAPGPPSDTPEKG
jgi:hypothetical protein